MDKKHEVEFRALISQKIFDELLERGQTILKDTFNGPLVLLDAYFCAKEVNSFKGIEMNNVGSYSLRLRSEKKSDKEANSMNTKVIQFEGDHNAWLEHEIKISSFDEAEQILNVIGFKKFFELKKKRYSFEDAGVHVCLEDIENFQPAIEVEIMATKDDTEKAKKNLLSYLAQHKIDNKMIVSKSITNILMKERSKF